MSALNNSEPQDRAITALIDHGVSLTKRDPGTSRAVLTAAFLFDGEGRHDDAVKVAMMPHLASLANVTSTEIGATTPVNDGPLSPSFGSKGPKDPSGGHSR